MCIVQTSIPSKIDLQQGEHNLITTERIREPEVHKMSRTVIASVARTPIGKFQGNLSALKGSELGSIAIKAALSRLPGDVGYVREAIMGNVVS